MTVDSGRVSRRNVNAMCVNRNAERSIMTIVVAVKPVKSFCTKLHSLEIGLHTAVK